MKHDTPGCATVDCCRPCCSAVWDFVRSDYSTITAKLYGTVGSLAPSDPMVNVASIYESVTVGSITSYQCLQGAGNEEEFPPALLPTPASLPCRWVARSRVQPGGSTVYYYALSAFTLQVNDCLPTPLLAVNSSMLYRWHQTGNPSAALGAAGYILDPTFFSTYWQDRYYQTSGFFTHEVLVLNWGSFYECEIAGTYIRNLTNTADMITSLPNPLTITPPWNPGSMVHEVTFS